MRILIVGCSLVGGFAALALREAGLEADVVEAAPEVVNRAGGVIGLEHPTLEALERVGIDHDEVVPFRGERVVKLHVRDRVHGDCTQTIYPGRNTTWSLLFAAITRRLPADAVQFGSRVRADGDRFTLEGRELDYDLVIFCDGRTSVGRRVLDPGRRLRYAGYVAHRGQCTSGACASPSWVRFTVADRNMLATFPVGHAGVDWTFYANATADEYARWFGMPPVRRPFALPQHVSDEARRYVDDAAAGCLPDDEVALVVGTRQRAAAAVMDVDPPTRMVWSRSPGRFEVLLGDALAPVRPHTARGANNGIEQVADLVGVVRQHVRYGADLEAGLAALEARHLLRVVDDVRRGPTLGAQVGLGI